MARNYVALPWEYREEMEELTDEEFGRLIRGLLRYSENGEKIKATGNERFYAKRVMTYEDRVRESYDKTVAARKEAGEKSGEARRNKTEQTRTNANKTEQAETKSNKNDNTNTNTNKNKNTNNTSPNGEGVRVPAPARACEKRFVPPTVDEVAAYAREKGLTFDAEEFVDYYANKQWRIGGSRTQMSDWRAAARNWVKKEWRDKPKPKERNSETSSYQTDEFFTAASGRTYGDDQLVRELKVQMGVAG